MLPSYPFKFLFPPKPIPNPNAEYTFQQPYPQRFSLPYPVIKYIFENLTPMAWKKTIQCCKYFFPKHPIYPVFYLFQVGFSMWNIDKKNVFESQKPIPKLWLFNEFCVYNRHFPNTLSNVIPKISKCNLQYLSIGYQNLSLEEYQFLTASSSVKTLNFNDTQIHDSDNSLVTLDKLIKNLYKLQELVYSSNISSMINQDTARNIKKILPCLQKMQNFHLYSLTESFDFLPFTEYLMKNQTVQFSFCYIHDLPLSNAYKKMLDQFIEKIIPNPPPKIPHISYHGLDDIKYAEYFKFFVKRI